MAKTKIRAIAVTDKPQLLSRQAQDLFNQLGELKEEMVERRESRQEALMENPRYASLRDAAQKIVKDVTTITKKFDLDHPGYKKDIQAVADDAREVHIALAKVAIQAMKDGVELEIYSGVGSKRKRVQLNFSVQPTLFGE